MTFGRPPLERSGQVDVARELLTPLDGAPPITLAPASYLVADVAAGLVVGQNDPSDADTPPSLELVDSATGAVVHALGAGYPLGAQGNSLLVQGGGCSASTTPAACTLVDIEVSTGKVTATVALPAGSVPTSDAVFSADGTRAALQITQAEPDPRFSTGHPFPPSEVVMVHLDTGVIGRVANMVIPPKTVLGLAFSSSGEALFITVGEGADSDLLVWQDTMVSPAFVTTLPGAVTGAPPIVRTSR